MKINTRVIAQNLQVASLSRTKKFFKELVDDSSIYPPDKNKINSEFGDVLSSLRYIEELLSQSQSAKKLRILFVAAIKEKLLNLD